MSQPPYDPRRQPPRSQRPQPPQQPYNGGGEQYGDQYGNQYPDQQYGYNQPPPQQYRQQQPQQPRPPQAQQYRSSAPPPRESRPSSSGGGIRLPGLGMLLTLIGTVVQILSLTVLPWVATTKAGGDKASLYDIYHALTDGSGGGAHSFGDWYVVLFSYPLVVLGILLAFAAVLESVAAKVIWGVLALLGLAFLVARYGFGPLTGMFGSKSAMHFSTVEIIVAVVALIGVVIVAFTLKMAVSMFRRVAGVILLVLSGVHIFAVMDLVKASSLSELSVGAFGPSVGYLLIGIAALIGPRRLVPGL